MITTDINHICSALLEHEIAAIPTETVYGLAANAFDEEAIKRVFALKQRPLTHPLIMHVKVGYNLSTIVDNLTPQAEILINHLWPGPLTLVVQAKPNILSPLVNGGQQTVAIRCPSHPMTRALLERLNIPLVAPSANSFGKISPTTAEHVEQSFNNPDWLVLDGGRCQLGIESTIIDVTDPEGYRILRHGATPQSALDYLLPNGQLDNDSPDTNKPRVSGQLETHYQPHKPLHCFSNKRAMMQFCRETPNCYVMSFTKQQDFASYAGMELAREPAALAYQLYYELRQADNSSAAVITMEMPPADIRWEGVRERLLKAGIFH